MAVKRFANFININIVIIKTTKNVIPKTSLAFIINLTIIFGISVLPVPSVLKNSLNVKMKKSSVAADSTATRTVMYNIFNI